EPTYRNWGEPLLLPRAQLAALIERTLEGRPRLLIVDIDFTRGDGTGDAALANALVRHGHPEAATPILLARALGPPDVPTDADRGEEAHPPRLRPSFLDPFVARSPNLHWASVWMRAMPDAVVRRWPLWQPACDSAGRAVALPSMPLAALSLLG